MRPYRSLAGVVSLISLISSSYIATATQSINVDGQTTDLLLRSQFSYLATIADFPYTYMWFVFKGACFCVWSAVFSFIYSGLCNYRNVPYLV